MTRKFVGIRGSAVAFVCVFLACHESRTADRATTNPAALAAVPRVAASHSEATIPASSASSFIAPAPSTPATVEQAPVTKDSPAWFVRGENPATSRVVFMPGLCSNAAAYLLAFPEAAKAHGGVVAIDGDKPCGAKNSGFRSFTWNADLQRSRISKALASVGTSAPPDGFTLVGYSAGASIAELVHQKWPDLFPRLILIAPPEDLWIDKLLNAKAVVSMSCSYDVPGRMKDGAKKLGAKGVRSIYMEMPKCTHGNITEGERIFGEAFAWLDNGEGGEAGE
jgi:pimeloyl-ACP methyl ester carboxylesterase